MTKFIVYKVSSPSNKCYIGITSYSLNERKSKHFYSANKRNSQVPFHRAIRKYGELLVWEVLKTELTRKKANQKETNYIKRFNSMMPNGYNATSTGGGGSFKRTKETLEKCRKIHTKLSNQPERIKKASENTKQYFKNNPNARHKIGNLVKQRLKNPAYKKALYNKIKQKLSSYEYRLKNSKQQGGKPFLVFNFQTKVYIGTWDIQADCNKTLGIGNGKIAACLKGRRNKTQTYLFKYLDDPTVNGQNYNVLWDKALKRGPRGPYKRKKATKNFKPL